MRHFCSTTAKPPMCKNRPMLAHNALPKQPEGTEARNKSLSFFLYILRVRGHGSTYLDRGEGFIFFGENGDLIC